MITQIGSMSRDHIRLWANTVVRNIAAGIKISKPGVLQYHVTGQVVININRSNSQPQMEVYQGGVIIGTFFFSESWMYYAKNELDRITLDLVIDLADRALRDAQLSVVACLPTTYGAW